MSIVVNIYYSGENGSAQKFAKEMISSGTVDAIRNEAGNIRYDYFFPLGDEETVLLIDSWENQESIDFHHQSPMMNKNCRVTSRINSAAFFIRISFNNSLYPLPYTPWK